MWLSRTVITDASGEFAFQRLPAGAFTLAASHPQNQFLASNYGQRRPGGQGQYIQLTDGQKITLKLPMQRGAVISGLVVGPTGEPQPSVQVRASRYDGSSGFRRLQTVRYAQTDDRGVYRIFGLQPGDYLISATPNAADLQYAMQAGVDIDLVERTIMAGPIRPPSTAGGLASVAVPLTTRPPADQVYYSPSYLPTYAPNATTLADATVVTVGPSEEKTGVDIQVRLVSSTLIQGVVSTPLDAGVTVQLWLLSDDPAAQFPQGNQTAVQRTGSFAFQGVAPGTLHHLRADRRGRAGDEMGRRRRG
jgi:hypothetical protein